MFSNWLQRLDFVNLIGFLFGGTLLLLFHHEPLEGILLLVAGGLLLASKLRPSRIMTFATFFIHVLAIGLFIQLLLPLEQIPVPPFILFALIAAIIATLTVMIRSGTSTLTMFWFSAHVLIISQAFISDGSFWENIWNPANVAAMFQTFFSVLIMFFLIGIFFDRYRTEMTNEYRNR